MVNTTELLPSPLLQPFVRCFILREFDTKGSDLYRPMPAAHEFMLTFNLNDTKVKYIKPDADKQQTETMHSDMVLTGVNNQFNGIMIGNGNYRLFSVQFRLNGFYRIFGIPASYFTNRIQDGQGDWDKNIITLHQQLCESANIYEIIWHTENYLLHQLQKSKANDPYNVIQLTSDFITQNIVSVSVEQMAYKANMSMKTFERKFTEQVGVAPKLFARIVRFNKALSLKLNSHQQSWTSVAHDCGYFDQMHFIKDFKLFTGETPTSFFRLMPLPKENIIKA